VGVDDESAVDTPGSAAAAAAALEEAAGDAAVAAAADAVADAAGVEEEGPAEETRSTTTTTTEEEGGLAEYEADVVAVAGRAFSWMLRRAILNSINGLTSGVAFAASIAERTYSILERDNRIVT